MQYLLLLSNAPDAWEDITRDVVAPAPTYFEKPAELPHGNGLF